MKMVSMTKMIVAVATIGNVAKYTFAALAVCIYLCLFTFALGFFIFIGAAIAEGFFGVRSWWQWPIGAMLVLFVFGVFGSGSSNVSYYTTDGGCDGGAC